MNFRTAFSRAARRARTEPTLTTPEAADPVLVEGLMEDDPMSQVEDQQVADTMDDQDNAPEQVEPQGTLRKKDLIERVLARTELKRREVKPALEAALEVIGEALGNGEELRLGPLGNLRINKRKQVDNGEVLFARIRRRTEVEKTDDTPLAEAAE